MSSSDRLRPRSHPDLSREARDFADLRKFSTVPVRCPPTPGIRRRGPAIVSPEPPRPTSDGQENHDESAPAPSEVDHVDTGGQPGRNRPGAGRRPSRTANRELSSPALAGSIRGLFAPDFSPCAGRRHPLRHGDDSHPDPRPMQGGLARRPSPRPERIDRSLSRSPSAPFPAIGGVKGMPPSTEPTTGVLTAQNLAPFLSNLGYEVRTDRSPAGAIQCTV